MLPTGKKDGKDKGASNDKDKSHDASALNGEEIGNQQKEFLTIKIFFAGDDTSDPNDSSLNTSDDKSSPGKRRVSF